MLGLITRCRVYRGVNNTLIFCSVCRNESISSQDWGVYKNWSDIWDKQPLSDLRHQRWLTSLVSSKRSLHAPSFKPHGVNRASCSHQMVWFNSPRSRQTVQISAAPLVWVTCVVTSVGPAARWRCRTLASNTRRFIMITTPVFPLQSQSGSGLHGVNGGAGSPPSAELQADGDPEEGVSGAGQSRSVPDETYVEKLGRSHF